MPEPAKIPVSMPLSTPESLINKMPKARKRFIIAGNVQLAGYRVLVKAFARNLGLVGFVRNQPDNTVEIVCEGEPAILKRFLEMINKKGDPANPMEINVDSINESPPPPEGELKIFEVNYDGELSPQEREKNLVEREERMILGASLLSEKVGSVGKDVRNMHEDMNKRFDHMADRYDMIAASLKEAIVHMDWNAEKTDKAIEKSRKETIIAVHRSEERTAKILKESHKELAASNRELAKAVNFMIKKLSGKPAGQRLRKSRK